MDPLPPSQLDDNSVGAGANYRDVDMTQMVNLELSREVEVELVETDRRR